MKYILMIFITLSACSGGYPARYDKTNAEYVSDILSGEYTYSEHMSSVFMAIQSETGIEGRFYIVNETVRYDSECDYLKDLIAWNRWYYEKGKYLK